MKRAVRTARPERVTSVTSTEPRELAISTRRPARRRQDVEALHAVTDVHDDLDPVSLHGVTFTIVTWYDDQPAGSDRVLARATSPSQWALGLGCRSKVTGSTAQMPSLGPNPRCHSKLSSRLHTK